MTRRGSASYVSWQYLFRDCRRMSHVSPLVVIPRVLAALSLVLGPGLGALAAPEPPLASPGLPESPGASPGLPESTENDWRGTVEFYGLAPLRTTGTTTIRGFSADTDVDLGQLIPLLQSTVSFRAAAEKGRVGVLTDLSYVQLGDEKVVTSRRGLFTGTGRLGYIQGLYDLALRYRFGDPEAAVARPGAFTVIPYGGLRLVNAQLHLNAQVEGRGPLGLKLEREKALTRTWAQLLLGTQATLFLSPRLRAFARADIGGFGLAGAQDLTGNAQVGLGYAVGNNTDLNLSWRYLGIAYDNGADRSTGFTSYQNGLELGVKVFF